MEYVQQIFEIMAQCPQHTFQILTKRSKPLKRLCSKLPWPDNVWMGVTVEHSDYLYRIKDLRATPAKVKFLSLEPLLGPIESADFLGIDWVIVGGESGPGARPMDPTWVRSLRDQCRKQEVKFFFKQWGGVNKKAAGRKLDGKLYSQMPPLLNISEQIESPLG